eukprot:Clim_evm57s134 gene=Clim_evmTU57s134
MSPEEWEKEYVSVQNELKITVHAEARDWRSHFQTMRARSQMAEQASSVLKGTLAKLTSEIDRSLEKVHSREKHINMQLEHQMAEFRKVKEQVSGLEKSCSSKSKDLEANSEEIASIKTEIAAISHELDDKGSKVTDQSPLVNIKKSMEKLRKETQEMDFRIGVLQYVLLNEDITMDFKKNTASWSRLNGGAKVA